MKGRLSKFTFLIACFMVMGISFNTHAQCPNNVSTPSGCPTAVDIMLDSQNLPPGNASCANPSDSGCATFTFTNIPLSNDPLCPVEVCFTLSQGCGVAMGNICFYANDGFGGCIFLGVGGNKTQTCMIVNTTTFSITACRPGNGPVSINDISVGPCCEFTAVCPTNKDLGTFDCNNLNTIPAPPTTGAEASSPPYNITIGPNPCGTIEVTSMDDATPDPCVTANQTITRTVTVFDDLDGNGALDTGEESEICIYTYTITPTAGPTIDCTALGGTITCATQAIAGTPTFTSNCGMGVLSVTGPVINGTPDCPNTTYTFTHTVTDDCMRTASCDEVFTIQNADPTIDCSGLGGTIMCATQAIAGTPTFTVSCTLGGVLSVTGPVINGDPDCPNTTYTFTHTVTDDCMRTASCDEVFTIQNADPTIDCSGLGGTIMCATQAIAGTPTFTVSCTLGGVLSVTGPVINGDPDCPNTTYTFTHTVTDDCMRTASCDEVFTIQNDAPTIDCAGLGGTITCAAQAIAGTPTFTVSCSLTGMLSVTGPVINGTPDCPNTTYTFTHTVTDDCMRTASCDEVFTIQNADPTIDCSGLGGTIMCATQAIAGTPTFTTSCTLGGVLSVTGPVINGTPDCPNTTYTFTHTVTDDCMRTASCDEVFTIQNADPTIDCSGLGGTIMCATQAIAGTPTFTTSCTLGGVLSVTGPVINGTLDCPNTTYTFTHTVEDLCGRTATCDEVFTIQNDGPTIVCPADMTVQCEADIVVDAANATVTTSCMLGFVTWVDQPHITGARDCDGTTYEYTYHALDDCGRMATCVQTWTLENDPPTITCTAGGNVECFEDIVVGVGDATVTTSCGEDLDITIYTPVINGEPNCPGTTYTYTYRVEDQCEREATCDRVFTIQNTLDPVVTAPDNVTCECLAGVNAWPHNASVETGCGVDAEINVTGPVISGPVDCPGTTYTYTYTATDACDREGSATQTFTVNNGPPVFDNCPENCLVLNCEDEGWEDVVQAWLNSITAKTSCGQPLTVLNDYNPNNQGTCINDGTTTVTWRATDNCGRTSTCQSMVIINDTEPPIFIEEAQDELDICNYNTPHEFDAWVDAHAHAIVYDCDDNITSNQWSTIPNNPSFPNCMNVMGSTSVTVTFVVRDDCGNKASSTATFTALMAGGDLVEDEGGEAEAANDLGFSLNQNQPNPFKNETLISFNLPEATAASLTVYDISGKVIKVVQGDYSAGYHNILINSSELRESGVLIYKLQTKQGALTKRMILLD